jgi:uncharacterized RDD family membrane protein YckC
MAVSLNACAFAAGWRLQYRVPLMMPRALWFCVWCCLAMAWPAWAAAASPPAVMAAGDDQNIWIIRQADRDSFTILHRYPTDPAYAVRTVGELGGRIAPSGVAAAAGRLWLVYQGDGTVQSVRLVRSLAPNLPLLDSPRLSRALPRGVVLRSLAADQRGLWALVRVRDAHTLARVDAPPAPASQPESSSAALTTSPALPVTVSPSAASTTSAPATAPAASPDAPLDAMEVDRLLRLDEDQWRKVDLPDDWTASDDARAWVIAPRAQGEQPVLVLAPADAPVVLYHRDTEQSPWLRRQFPITAPREAELAPMAVEGQVVLGVVRPDPVHIIMDLCVLRPESVSTLGKLQTSDVPEQRWTATGAGQLAALIAMAPSGELTWTATDLRGEFVDPPAMLVHQIPKLEIEPRRLLVVAVLAVAMLIMFAIWRRDPAWNRLNLPRDRGLSDHTRRMAALAIDLAPCLLVASLVSGVPLDQLLDHWPGVASAWEDMLPGAIAIALYILHTTIAEAIWRRSLGKTMLGLEVVTMTGGQPRLWQIIARNLLKVGDLTVFYILPVLVLVGPYRQRLGDLLAGTVVVLPVDPEQDHDDSNDLD